MHGTRTHLLLKCSLHAVMKAACQKAEAVFRKGNTPLDAVVAAVAVLEVSHFTPGPDKNWNSLLSWSASPMPCYQGHLLVR